MGIATDSWPTDETDPQRIEILAAADRLLAGAPHRSTGNLSVVQLAVEADIKYWVIAQKHTDLRTHFQQLVGKTEIVLPNDRMTPEVRNEDQARLNQLREHCDNLEKLIQNYAVVINELAHENQALRHLLASENANVISIRRREPVDPEISRPGKQRQRAANPSTMPR